MKLKHYILILIFMIAGGAMLYLLVFQGSFSFFSKSKYDVVDKVNPKMTVLVNQELDRMVSEYGSGMYAYRPEAPANLEKFYRELKTIETYSRHGTNSIMGYNGIRANLIFQNGREVRELYITSGGKSRSTQAKLYLRIELEDGRAREVFTNGIELEGTPDEAKGSIRELIERIISLDKKEHHDRYFYPQPPPPDPATEWEKVK